MIRALTVFNQVPAGCVVYPVTNDDSDPHLRAGEFALIDTDDREPQHGELYAVRWSSGRTDLQQVLARPFKNADTGLEQIGYWTRCLNFAPYTHTSLDASQEGPAFISKRSMADGPRLVESLRDSLLGRVIGIYQAMEELPRLQMRRDTAHRIRGAGALKCFGSALAAGFPVRIIYET